MIEITDDLLDAAVAAYVDAIDLDVTNKHLMTKVLEAVIPLIAAAERKECARITIPGRAPCDCDSCGCDDIDAAEKMAAWRERKLTYDAIRDREDRR